MSTTTFPELLRPYTKTALARELGVDPSTVTRWANKESVPEVRMLPALARILRVDLADLTRMIAGEAA